MSEATTTPGADQLDVEAEQAAVTAINRAREASSAIENFDREAHRTGVFGTSALTHLREARTLLLLAEHWALNAQTLQAQADQLRESERTARVTR